MATGGRPPRKPDKKDESKSDVGGWLGVLGGAVAAAGLIYGAKKAYDYLSSDKEERGTSSLATSKEKELEQFYAGDKSYDHSPQNHINYSSDSLQVSTSDFGKISLEHLQDNLEEYYQSYANIPLNEMAEATAVVDQIKAALLTYFQTKHAALGINDMINTGSSSEGLKVVAPDEFDVMFPIYLEGRRWRLEDGRNSDLHAPGFSFVHRINTAEHPIGSDVHDKFLDEAQYLSPVKFRRACQGYVVMAANTIQKYKVTSSTHGPAITLHVTYNDSKQLDIDFVPTMVIDGVWVVAKPHHEAREDDAFENLWRHSFSRDEFSHLMSLSPHRFCHLKVLKIMKAIRLNRHAQFGMFTSYIYKTVLMHMLDDIDDEDEWRDECLQERFKDLLITLKNNLQAQQLKHYFCSGVNLLDAFSSDSCYNLQNYIGNVVGKNRFNKLLEK